MVRVEGSVMTEPSHEHQTVREVAENPIEYDPCLRGVFALAIDLR